MSLLDKIKSDIVESHVWKSIFRHGYDDTPRNRVMMVTSNVFLHLHPAKVRRHAVRMRFTWCMGGLTFLMFLITAITGIYLMFYYRPVAEYAYADMKYLEFDMPFGMLMRNMHRWAAHAMIVFVWLHMFRVFLTGSYKPPREFNWIVGVLLLGADAAFEFHRLFIAVGPARDLGRDRRLQHGARDAALGLRGALRRVRRRQPDLRCSRLFIRRRRDRPAHAAAFLYSALHLHSAGRQHPDGRALLAHSPRRLLRSVSISNFRIEARKWQRLPAKESFPLMIRSILGRTWCAWSFSSRYLSSVALTLWSLTVDAPLEEPANPTRTPNPSKAPWYFLGLQEMLVYFDPWNAGVVLPSLIIVGLMVIPYIDINPKGNGYYCFKDRKWEILTFFFGFHILWITMIIIGTFFRGPGWNLFWPWQKWDPHKVVALTNVDLPYLVGFRDYWLSAVFSLVVIGAYFVVGDRSVLLFCFEGQRQRVYRALGHGSFYDHRRCSLLMMLSLPAKMVLAAAVQRQIRA